MAEVETKQRDEEDKKAFDDFTKMIEAAKFSPNMDKVLLERYLKVSDNNLDNAFALLKHGLELRSKAAYLFTSRDLTSKEIQTAYTAFQFVPLKKLTKENYKITIVRFQKCDSSIYDSVHVFKAALMMFDANYTFYDNGDNSLVEGEIYMLDPIGFSFMHLIDLTKNVKTFMAYTKFLQESAPVRLISNHIVNVSTVLDGVMNLIKPMLNKKVSEVVHLHKHGSDSLLKYFDKDVLPIDYGGTNGTLDEHYKEWQKQFETKRDYLLNDDIWKISSDDT